MIYREMFEVNYVRFCCNRLTHRVDKIDDVIRKISEKNNLEFSS
jgi:hypothetical protein